MDPIEYEDKPWYGLKVLQTLNVPDRVTIELMWRIEALLKTERRYNAGKKIMLAVSAETWHKLLASEDFMKCVDPARRHSDVVRGVLGLLFGAEIVTDAFDAAIRPEELALPNGLSFCIAQ